MKTKIFALHGFLGNASDWDSVFGFIKDEKPEWELYSVDLLNEPMLSPNHSFEDWAKNFSTWVMAKGEGARTLLGYSMGGRLALHALEANPELWNACVLLSTNPGLSSVQAKSERIQSDKVWVEKFLTEEWSKVLAEWNSQNIFSGGKEVNYPAQKDKELLVKYFLNWSLGKQKDFRVLLDMWQIRQIWAAGSKDRKFVELLKSIPNFPEIQKWEVEEASHRLIFDAPEEVAHFALRISMPLPTED